MSRKDENPRPRSIRTSYVTGFTILVLAVILSAGYFCLRSYRAARDDHLSNARNDFENSFQAIDSFYSRLNHLATIVQYNSSLVNVLSGSETLTTDEFRRTRQDLLPMIISLSDGTGDYECRIYVHSSLLRDQTSYILQLDGVSGLTWARETMAGWGQVRLFSAREMQSDRPAFLSPIRNLQRTFSPRHSPPSVYIPRRGN